jgi:uncharacterized protein YkwD
MISPDAPTLTTSMKDVMKRSVATFLAAAILVCCTVNGVFASRRISFYSVPGDTTQITTDDDFNSLRNDILDLINQYRARKGKPALALADEASAEAETHSKRMAKGAVNFGHGGFDERSARLLKKIKGINATAENVAYGYSSAEEVVKGWLNSPGHRKNIEGNYNVTGIGVARSRNGDLYYTQIFLNKR